VITPGSSNRHTQVLRRAPKVPNGEIAILVLALRKSKLRVREDLQRESEDQEPANEPVHAEKAANTAKTAIFDADRL
jgi:hypothetical protein